MSSARLKNTARLSVFCIKSEVVSRSSIQARLMVSHDEIEITIFWQGYHRNDVTYAFSVCHILIICLITGDVKFSHMIKVVSARSLHCKVFFVNSKYVKRVMSLENFFIERYI